MTESRLAFIVDYHDSQAGIVRKYQLCYFTNDDTIEMHDIKNRRIFLKRCSYPQVRPLDLYLGATVTIYARKLTVVGFADEATRQIYSVQAQSVLIVVLPEGYEQLGNILREANLAGFRVKQMNMLKVTQAEAADLLGDASEAAVWASHPIVPVELVREDGYTEWLRLAKSVRFINPSTVWYSPSQEDVPSNVDWFFGNNTRSTRNSATLQNCTLCIVKPHAVSAGHGGSIVNAILEEGFEITALKLFHLDKADAEDFLEVYKGVVPEYVQLVEQLSSGPLWAMEIKGENSVQAFRQICGPHDPDIAKVLHPNTIRAKFGETRVLNAVHCTDLPEDGVLESDYFFSLLKSPA